ncbi:hypothetical protein SB14R_10265 [Pseudomonas oryzihabitans]|nr:hypothetical protein SB14R_10265 [Pseudomonas psychrotolerans]
MFDQPTSSPTPNAISSPASGCGPTLFAAPDGQMIDLFGPVPVLANLSPRQARELGLMTSGISGRTSIGSSASASLQSSLESRLRAKTQTLGSTLYRLTWKPWRTPSGPSRSRLRASVLRTSAIEPTGWPTATATDALRHPGFRFTTKNITLNHAAVLTGWGTPTANECGGTPERFLERKSQLGGRCGVSLTPLNLQVQLAAWPTPNAGTPQSLRGFGQDPERRKEQGHQINLKDAVRYLIHDQPARLTASGQMLTGFSAGMESGGQLNPAHSRWLMGLPPEWDACAPTATRSTRKRP